MKKIASVIAILLLAACASKGKVQEVVIEEVERPEFKGPVCLLEAPLPLEIKYEVIDDVSASKTWYGSVDQVLAPLADEAREVGGNVVIKVKSGHNMGALAWVRPYAKGQAVWVNGFTAKQCTELAGKLR